MYPFLFRVMQPGRQDTYIVVVAKVIDYVYYASKWMNDDDLPHNKTLVPNVDLEESKHPFDTEAEAMAFIKDWRRSQPESKKSDEKRA